MKKFLTVPLLLFFILQFFAFPFLTPNKKVHSASLYYRVLDDDVPFYTDVTSVAPLFYLPYSYYVKVLDVTNGLARVECSTDNLVAIDGYVPFDMLFDDGQLTTEPYLNLTITTARASTLYSDSSLSFPIQYLFKNRTLSYYGALIDGVTENVYYVGYNGRLGYVKESDVIPFDIPLHKNPLPSFDEGKGDDLGENTAEKESLNSKIGNNTLQLIILISLALAGVIGLIIAVVNKKSPQQSTACSYYDESDYE